jgi:hypothetical protein
VPSPSLLPLMLPLHSQRLTHLHSLTLSLTIWHCNMLTNNNNNNLSLTLLPLPWLSRLPPFNSSWMPLPPSSLSNKKVPANKKKLLHLPKPIKHPSLLLCNSS